MMIDYHDFYYGDEERVDDSFVEDDEDVQDQVTAGGLSILSCWVKKIDDDCEDDSEYGDNDDDDDYDNDDDNHQISWWNCREEAILSNCCTIAEAQAVVAEKWFWFRLKEKHDLSLFYLVTEKVSTLTFV